MKYQILRRPVRYMAGVLMILVAVATLCVTGSQSMYARLLVEKIENAYIDTINSGDRTRSIIHQPNRFLADLFVISLQE